MAYRNKVFVSFDGDSDIHYYRLLRAWKQNDNTAFDFHDAHNLNTARDSSSEETIKRRLRERLSNSKVFVSLIGDKTRYLYRFVRWEIEQALSLNLPIIGVNLSNFRQLDSNRCPPLLRHELVVYISFNAAILQYALENWPNEFQRLETKSVSGPRFYNDSVYKQLGL